jgi:hypothetical protein
MKTMALGVTKGATEAAQAMAAIPGPAGMVVGGFMGLTTIAEAAVVAMSGIALLRKEAEIQKKHFQEISSKLTEYTQALSELTNSYGDPTVTQKTIARLNKKMMDTLSSLPDTKEAVRIKASIMGAATPEQKQRAAAEDQDYLARQGSQRAKEVRDSNEKVCGLPQECKRAT